MAKPGFWRLSVKIEEGFFLYTSGYFLLQLRFPPLSHPNKRVAVLESQQKTFSVKSVSGNWFIVSVTPSWFFYTFRKVIPVWLGDEWMCKLCKVMQNLFKKCSPRGYWEHLSYLQVFEGLLLFLFPHIFPFFYISPETYSHNRLSRLSSRNTLSMGTCLILQVGVHSFFVSLCLCPTLIVSPH